MVQRITFIRCVSFQVVDPVSEFLLGLKRSDALPSWGHTISGRLGNRQIE
jgi:hypothetical protein